MHRKEKEHKMNSPRFSRKYGEGLSDNKKSFSEA